MVWRPIVILIAAWTVCAGLGLARMLTYELTPATGAAAPAIWPQATGISRDASGPTLVLFLHPRCPCSRATLAELERLIAACDRPFALRIVFVRPAGTGDDWNRTDLHRAAERIPHAVVSDDADGIEAARFDAKTSGQALLYAADGRLLFQGGLTASRGHEGDNVGRSALSALISGSRSNCTQTAVFGCSLVNSSRTPELQSSDATTD
jgi:hypothetical protein